MQPFFLFLLCSCSFSLFAQDEGKDSTTAPVNDSLYQSGMNDLVQDEIPTLSLDEDRLDDAGTQAISSILTAGRDPFLTAAAFNFNIARFKFRGYDNNLSATYLNGLLMQNLDNESTPYYLWSGLNDVLRNREIYAGIRYHTFGYGNIGIVTNIDARASKQRPQTTCSYAFSNRSYTHRWMITHSTGLNAKGWAFSFSASRRWSGEGYVPGTYYDAWSAFIGVDKQFNTKQILSLTAFYTPVENGRQGASTLEMQELAGSSYYNPYWGYQQGKKRNASISKSNEPLFILNDVFSINVHTTMTTAAGYSFGKRKISGIDWYHAPDPRPDYYKYLPSYQADSAQRAQLQQLFQQDENLRQINWEELYATNQANFETVYGIDGNPSNHISGKRALYILQNRVIQTQKLFFSSQLNTKIGEHVFFTGGIQYQWQRNHYYQEIADLLGGDFYIDLNQFAEQDFPNDPNALQNDLRHPNRVVKVGDRYGYNYAITLKREAAFSSFFFPLDHVDLFVGAEVSQTSFYRTGYVQNGLFPDHSLGNSIVNLFTNYSVKAGITYKLNGRNYFYVNAAQLTRAPLFDNVYISPRSRDIVQDSVRNENIFSAEAGYVLHAPKINFRIGAYYTTIRHALNVLTFYDDDYSNFVNYALRNIDRRYQGIEMGFEIKLLPVVSLNGAASLGQYFYTGRQHATIILDNSAAILADEIVYSENYKLPVPQQAFSLGLSYRSPAYWFLSVTGNYFNDRWLDFNPVRRTYNAIEGVDPASALWGQILDQEKLPAAFTVDFFGGITFRLRTSIQENKPTYLAFLAGISNLLNNREFISGGYEQLRFDFAGHDVQKFPSKYYYAYGINFFLGLSLRF